MQTADVTEVFASFQGEGPEVGRRHIFVRFAGCQLRCQYCDTPAALASHQEGRTRSCRAQVSNASFLSEDVPNPVSSDRLSELCSRLSVPGPGYPVLSLTGGEPLLQSPFLEQWLPVVRPAYRIYLETNGIDHQAMKTLSGKIDVVSMDIKLPSSTGQGPQWMEHGAFLDAAAAVRTYVKVVITRSTTFDDLQVAAELVAKQKRDIPFIIQPCTGKFAPPAEMLVAMQINALAVLEDVRVIPQVHRILNVP